jgi:EpsI family protein
MRFDARWAFLLVPFWLGVQAIGLRLAVGEENLPPMPNLAAFPRTLDEWAFVRDDDIAPEITEAMRADRVLSRTYLRRGAGASANLLIAWFQSQRSGNRQPHSPKVCLPGSGWTPVATGDLTITTPTGNLRVNRYVVSNGGLRVAVLYWYESAHRSVAGEWEAKAWLVADAIRYRRTDAALVRVMVPVYKHFDDDATRVASEFVKAAYPSIRSSLPSF